LLKHFSETYYCHGNQCWSQIAYTIISWSAVG